MAKYRTVNVPIPIMQDCDRDLRIKRLAKLNGQTYEETVAAVVQLGCFLHIDDNLRILEVLATERTGIDITTPIP